MAAFTAPLLGGQMPIFPFAGRVLPRKIKGHYFLGGVGPAPGALPQLRTPFFEPSRGNISSFGGGGWLFRAHFWLLFLANLGPPFLPRILPFLGGGRCSRFEFGPLFQPFWPRICLLGGFLTKRQILGHTPPFSSKLWLLLMKSGCAIAADFHAARR